eukprot:gb/GECG01012949.1/.p1 GENE.gb/GECG01012949.1/~~gb/GECG01012949.1/.p1  ORF type:complete len:181 (+),score=4.82 gb/GECG01012949.1/:1-543(+)
MPREQYCRFLGTRRSEYPECYTPSTPSLRCLQLYQIITLVYCQCFASTLVREPVQRMFMKQASGLNSTNRIHSCLHVEAHNRDDPQTLFEFSLAPSRFQDIGIQSQGRAVYAPFPSSPMDKTNMKRQHSLRMAPLLKETLNDSGVNVGVVMGRFRSPLTRALAPMFSLWKMQVLMLHVFN